MDWWQKQNVHIKPLSKTAATTTEAKKRTQKVAQGLSTCFAYERSWVQFPADVIDKADTTVADWVWEAGRGLWEDPSLGKVRVSFPSLFIRWWTLSLILYLNWTKLQWLERAERFLQLADLVSFTYTPRRQVAVLHSTSVFILWTNPYIVFHKNSINVQFYWQSSRAPPSLHPCHLLTFW